MSTYLIHFAANTAPVVHITPEEVFRIGPISVTNSMFYAWICSAFIILMSIIIARMVKIRPRKGLIQLYELGTEYITNMLASSLGDRAKGVLYAPYFVAIFFFILLSNWMGLLPGVGSAITINGTPAFRPFTADINGTLAVACVSMFYIQKFAIKESGLIPHLKHYFNGNLKNPFTWFLGIFEVLGEITRIFSLALRLFLNIAIGEIIIAVFAYLGALAAPITALPFVILEILVGALQAYIFVMLSTMYLSVAVAHHKQREQENNTNALPVGV